MFLPAFDPTREFETRAAFTAAGTPYEKGDAFPIDTVGHRLAQMLFEQHQIGFAGEAPTAAESSPVVFGDLLPKAKSEPAPDPEPDREPEVAPRMSAVELVDTYTREQLVGMAEGLDYPTNAPKAVIAEAIVEAGHGVL